MNQDVSPIDPDDVERIATSIAHCDFRVTMSKYLSGKGHAWIITVGESAWQRHLVVHKTEKSDGDVFLSVLTAAQSEKFGYDINTHDVECTIFLSSLIADGYRGVKRHLAPKAQPKTIIGQSSERAFYAGDPCSPDDPNPASYTLDDIQRS